MSINRLRIFLLTAATGAALSMAAPASAQVTQATAAPAPTWYQRVGQELNPATWIDRAKVIEPVWMPGQREETISVRRPVVETRMVEQAVTVSRPTTTYQPVLTDQGGWTTQEVVQPGGSRPRLRFVGGWTTDEATGQRYWRLPLLRFVSEQQPDRVEALRVWQSNPQWVQVPRTTMTQVTEMRQVPVQSVRYVEEQHTQQVPMMTRQWQEQQVGAPCNPCDVPGGAVPYTGETQIPSLEQQYQPPASQLEMPGPATSPSDTWPPGGVVPSAGGEAAQPRSAPSTPHAENDAEPLDPRRVAFRGELVPVERPGGKSLAEVARSSDE